MCVEQMNEIRRLRGIVLEYEKNQDELKALIQKFKDKAGAHYQMAVSKHDEGDNHWANSEWQDMQKALHTAGILQDVYNLIWKD